VYVGRPAKLQEGLVSAKIEAGVVLAVEAMRGYNTGLEIVRRQKLEVLCCFRNYGFINAEHRQASSFVPTERSKAPRSIMGDESREEKKPWASSNGCDVVPKTSMKES
jgi:hypothetical protein